MKREKHLLSNKKQRQIHEEAGRQAREQDGKEKNEIRNE
jgi:hypothetical protein